jgi:hypothetical protein
MPPSMHGKLTACVNEGRRWVQGGRVLVRVREVDGPIAVRSPRSPRSLCARGRVGGNSGGAGEESGSAGGAQLRKQEAFASGSAPSTTSSSGMAPSGFVTQIGLTLLATHFTS